MGGIPGKENCLSAGIARAKIQIGALLPIHSVTRAMMGNFEHGSFWQLLATVVATGAVPVFFQRVTAEQGKAGAPTHREDGGEKVRIGEGRPFSACPASVNVFEFVPNGFIRAKAVNF